MATDVRVGGAFVTLSAQSGPYVAGVGAASAANRRLIQSYAGFNATLVANNRLFSRFNASLQSSLLATAAYAAGVGVVASALRGVFTGFLDYDQALIRISKTTGIANEELDRLGERLVAIGTERFRGRRPIDISREDIFDIAVAAGQAGVADPRGVEIITRSAAAVQSASDLIGGDAVRALTRYLQVTNQSIDRTDAISSAIVHLGNNVVGTESEISRYAVRTAQNLSAVGEASDAVILGISATLLEAGVEQEAAGTALQRAQIAILAASRDAAQFGALAPALGGTADEVEGLRQRFLDGTASAEDYDRALFALLRTLRDLSPAQRQPFLADFFGTGESNVRITRVIGALSNRYERLIRNTNLANDALETQDEHFTEAERASEAYRARLGVVARDLEEFGTNLGAQVVPGLTAVAENLDIVGTAALFAATGLATGFGRRRIAQIRETRAETLRLARVQEQQARQQVALARARQAERARGVSAAAVAAAAPVPAGVRASRQTTQLLRSLRQYERAAQTSAVRTQALVAAQTQLAAASRTAAQRIGALGRGLFLLFGGLPGLIIGGLAALPLIISALREDISELRTETSDLIDTFRELEDQQQQQAAGLTDVGAQAQRARELLVDLGREQIEVREELLAGLEGALAPTLPGFFARRISQAISELREGSDELSERAVEGIRLAGFGDALDQLLESVGQADELRRLLESLGFEEAAEEAEAAGSRILQTFEALPPSVLRAQQTFDAFRRSLRDASADAGTAALFDLSIASLDPIEQAQRRLIEGERLRIVQFQRANDLAAEQAAQALEVAEAEREALRAQLDRLDVGTEARDQAEAALTAAERQVTQTTAQVAVTARLRELSAGLTIDAERQVELGRIALEQRRAQVAEFETGTARQIEGIRPDLDSVAVGALRERIRLENDLEDALRDVTQTRQIDAEASVAHQQALREFYRILNAGSDALRDAQDDLLVNERARELAARRVLELNERRAAAGDAVSDALLDQVRAAELHLARLRAEQQELELTLAAVVQLQEAYRNLAASVTVAAERSSLDELVMSNEEILEELENFAADTFRGIADEAASALVSGEDNWRDFADNVIQELLRIAIQATIVSNLVAGLGLGEGQVGSLGNLFGSLFHEGGRTEDGGRRRQLRGGLRNDELFAILQKGEVVVPRHLAPHLLSGNFDALRGWLARLPRFHEGGIAGGGHLDREQIIQLTAAIQQLQAVVTQLSTVVARLGGEPVAPSGGFIETPAGMGGDVRGFLDNARNEVEGFASDASDTLRGFFLEDVPGFVDRSREFVDRQLGDDPRGPESRQPPYAGLFQVTRQFEEQARRDAERAREEGARDRRREESEILDSVQQLLERAREPVVIPGREGPDLLGPIESIDDSAQIIADSVREFADTASTGPAAPRELTAEEFRSFYRDFPQEFRDTVQEIMREGRRLLPADQMLNVRDVDALIEEVGRTARPYGDQTGQTLLRELQNLRDLIDRIEVDAPIPAFRPEPGAIFVPQFEMASFRGTGRVGDTPRPDLLEGIENPIILLREESRSAFEESGDALTNTFGRAGVAGAVLEGDSASLLEGVFSEGGLMGRVIGESEGLLSNLFGPEFSRILNRALGSIGGGGGILGSLFGFHEGSGDVGGGGTRYYRSAGLRSDELLAVLQKGEIVLPRSLAQRLRMGGFHSIGELQSALSRLPRFHEGGNLGGGMGGGGDRPIRFEVINQTNTPLGAVDNGQRVVAGEYVQSWILRDLRQNGPIAQGIGLLPQRRGR